MVKWSKDLIIEQIKELYHHGIPINNTAIVKTNEKLSGAGIRYFGSWRNAVEACGIDYDTIISEARSGPKSPHGTWNEEIILKKLKNRLDSGKPINAHSLQIEDSKLLAAATLYFGSIEKAITALDENYADHKKTSDWSKEKIIKIISEAYKSGAILSDATVESLNNSLYAASISYFGSWEQAVEASGIDYGMVSSTERWSQAKVKSYIFNLYNSGIPLNSKTIPNSILKKYKSINDLLSNIGISPDKYPESKVLSNRIKSERIKHGISQEVLGNLVGVSHRWIGMVENNLVDPKISIIAKIAKALNVTIDYLYSDK